MYLTIILLILSSAVLIFFAREFAEAFRTVFAVPGVKLVLPLLLVTQLIFWIEPWFLFAIQSLCDFLLLLQQSLASFFLVSRITQFLTQAIVICLLTVLPVWILDAWSFRRTFKPFPYKPILAAMLWLMWVILCLFY